MVGWIWQVNMSNCDGNVCECQQSLLHQLLDGIGVNTQHVRRQEIPAETTTKSNILLVTSIGHAPSGGIEVMHNGLASRQDQNYA
jgi:hypothetical protein